MNDQILKTFFLLSSYLPDAEGVRRAGISSGVMKHILKLVSKTHAPLLFWSNCSRHGLDRMMTIGEREYFENFREAAAARNLQLKSAFYEAAARLNENGISFTCLKGLYMICEVLKKDDARMCNDIDLLVSRKDFGRTCRILSDMRYRTEIRTTRRFYGSNELEMQNDSGIRFDVHHSFFPWFEERYIYSMQSGDTGNAAGPGQSVRGQQANCLCPEDAIFYTLICIFREDARAFRYFLDADILMKTYRDQIDWNALSEKISRTAVKTHLKSYLSFMKVFFNTPVPEFAAGDSVSAESVFRKLRHRIGCGDGLTDPPNMTRTRRVMMNTADPVIYWKIGLSFLKWQSYKVFGWFENDFSLHFPRAGELKG